MTSLAEFPIHKVHIVGTGLLGSSLGLALRINGFFVTGTDTDEEIEKMSLSLGALDSIGDDKQADLVFIATPHESVAGLAKEFLGDGTRKANLLVSDVSGIKAHVVNAVGHPRFVGGHPMAGSEQSGPTGADPELFLGSVWVLTPEDDTDLGAFSALQNVIGLLGAEVVVLSPQDHDRLVAVISHVPHLVAASLVTTAASVAKHDSVLLRLAAGGFRDMTRVAAGDAGIWPDVCCRNAKAIEESLDALISQLQATKAQVRSQDREALFSMLDTSSKNRKRLPEKGSRPDALAEIRLGVPDKQGVLAHITGMANDLGINIYDIEISHSGEDAQGVLSLLVALEDATGFTQSLKEAEYHATWRALGG